VRYEATDDARIETRVHPVSATHPARRTAIRHAAAHLDDDPAAKIGEKVRKP
jgi:hypothetical protein